VAIEDAAASALCDVMEKALIEAGIAPAMARTLAERACMPVAGAVVAPIAKKARKVNKTAARKMSAALREANKRMRTKSGRLRKGKTQADVMRLAQRLRRKM